MQLEQSDSFSVQLFRYLLKQIKRSQLETVLSQELFFNQPPVCAVSTKAG
jgi:hypothetical protein